MNEVSGNFLVENKGRRCVRMYEDGNDERTLSKRPTDISSENKTIGVRYDRVKSDDDTRDSLASNVKRCGF